jgi:hypothetical protein
LHKQDRGLLEGTIARVVGQPNEQFADSAKLEKAIRRNVGGLGYGG